MLVATWIYAVVSNSFDLNEASSENDHKTRQISQVVRIRRLPTARTRQHDPSLRKRFIEKSTDEEKLVSLFDFRTVKILVTHDRFCIKISGSQRTGFVSSTVNSRLNT